MARSRLVPVLVLMLLLPLAPMVGAGGAGLTTTLRYLGGETFEPTLGADANGNLFYSMTPVAGVAIGFGTGVWRSTDGGATWTDVSPKVGGVRMPPETNDPYVYVDAATGRVFQFAMFPLLACSLMSWSDDMGATWTTNPRGCGNAPPWDHQTMVSATPRGVDTLGYPTVLVQCVNQFAFTDCARSLDGGLTWAPSVPTFLEAVVDCHGLHGHLKASADGILYLPKDYCGESRIAISRDSGLTWTTGVVSAIQTQDWSDPTIAVDDAGNVYYAFVERSGRIMLSVSTDEGATWSPAVQVSPAGVTGHMPALAAGAAGKVVVAYPGTPDLPDGYLTNDRNVENAAKWHAYVSVATDALAAAPTYDTVVANPLADPLVRGPCGPARCPGMVDFIDVIAAPDGRAQAAFVDACTGKCATASGTYRDSTASQAVLVTVESPLLR